MKKEDLYQLKTHPSWCLRPFTLADAPAVVEIMRASSLANLGYADVDLAGNVIRLDCTWCGPT